MRSFMEVQDGVQGHMYACMLGWDFGLQRYSLSICTISWTPFILIELSKPGLL
jgi:hypothetical protein